MANRLPHVAAPAHPPTRDSSMAGWAFSWRWRALAKLGKLCGAGGFTTHCIHSYAAALRSHQARAVQKF